MSKKEYIQANQQGMAGGEIQRRWSEASPERNLLQGHQ